MLGRRVEEPARWACPVGRGSDSEMSPLGKMTEQVPLPWRPTRGIVQTVVSPVPETALGGRKQGAFTGRKGQKSGQHWGCKQGDLNAKSLQGVVVRLENSAEESEPRRGARLASPAESVPPPPAPRRPLPHTVSRWTAPGTACDAGVRPRCCALKKWGKAGKEKAIGASCCQSGTHRRPRRSTGNRTVSTEGSEEGCLPCTPHPGVAALGKGFPPVLSLTQHGNPGGAPGACGACRLNE